MKKNGIILNFKDKMINVDEVKLPMQNINYLQGSSTLHALKLNHSLAMEPHSTQDATKHAMQILHAKYKKADLQSNVRDNCKHLSTNWQKSTAATQEIWVALWQHPKWLEDQASLIPIRGGSITLTWSSSPRAKKSIKTSSTKRWRECANWGY